MRRFTFFILLVAALALAGGPASAVPQLLQYQGRLTDEAGEPLNEPVDVTFSIYASDESNKPALWSQTFEALTLDNGRFNVLLGGEETPFSDELVAALDEGEDLFLGIKVGDEPEMSPRQMIAAVAYALRAQSAESAGSAEEAERAQFAETSEFSETANSVVGMPGIAVEGVHRAVVAPGEAVSVVSITVTTPVEGFVYVTASGTLVLDNAAGGGALSHLNIGETADAVPDTTMGLVIAQIDRTATLARHYLPFVSQRVFAKTAGTYEFHLNVRNISGAGVVSANRPTITATFFPASIAAESGGEVRRSASSRR